MATVQRMKNGKASFWVESGNLPSQEKKHGRDSGASLHVILNFINTK